MISPSRSTAAVAQCVSLIPRTITIRRSYQQWSLRFEPEILVRGGGGRCRRCAVIRHEVRPRLLEPEADPLSVDHLDRGDAGLEGGRCSPAVSLERELHILGGHRLAVVEFDALAQHELLHETVTRYGPRFGEARRHGLARHR